MAIRNREKPKTALQKFYWKFGEGFNAFIKIKQLHCANITIAHTYALKQPQTPFGKAI